jgi:hypothetical protein
MRSSENTELSRLPAAPYRTRPFQSKNAVLYKMLSARATWATVLLAIALLLVNLRFLHSVVRSPLRVGWDEISAFEQKYGEIRHYLPSYGIVGYLDDNTGTSVARFKEYFEMQYMVAPIVLVNPDLPSIVANKRLIYIVNFHNGAADRELVEKYNLTMVRTFPNGLRLCVGDAR